MKLCLAPGHGGHDSGAVGPGGVLEKHAALTIALELEKELLKYGIECILTRRTDVFVSPAGQARIANDAGCDYMLAIHLNSAERIDAQGTETFVARSAPARSIAWGRALQDAMVSHLSLDDRGLKFANFTVLTATRMPAALIEPWFMHNQNGAVMASHSGTLHALARILAKAIATHLGILALPEITLEDPEEPPTCTPCETAAANTTAIAAHARSILTLVES